MSTTMSSSHHAYMLRRQYSRLSSSLSVSTAPVRRAMRPSSFHAACPSRDVRLGAYAKPAVCIDRARQPLLETDDRLPAEDGAGDRYVRSALPRIVLGQRPEVEVRGAAGHAPDQRGELQDVVLSRVAQVDRLLVIGAHQSDNALHQVVDILKAARLAAVAIDGQWLAAQRLAQQVGDDAAVVRRHARPIRIEDPADADRYSVRPVERRRQRFGIALALVVDASRSDGVDVAPVRL